MVSKKQSFSAVTVAKKELLTNEIVISKELIEESKEYVSIEGDCYTYTTMTQEEFEEVDARNVLYRCMDMGKSISPIQH